MIQLLEREGLLAGSHHDDPIYGPAGLEALGKIPWPA